MAALQIPPTLQMVKHDFIDKQAFKFGDHTETFGS